MSNQLAFATTTFTLQRQLNKVVGADVPNAVASTVRPDGNDGPLPAVGVNIYLLQATNSGDMGNPDLPSRNTSRQIVNKPTAIVELIYMLTFHGLEASLEPQRVQASVMRYLHSEPCLPKKVIRDTIAAAVAGDPNHFLKGSNLADQDVLVKVTPYKVSLEDLSKIWSVFFQTHYVLTSTYKASFILLDTEDAGQANFPVKQRGIFGLPFSEMAIESVSPDKLPFAVNAKIDITGRALIGANKSYLIDDVAGVLQAGATATAVTVQLPAALKAGLKTVKVVDQAPLGANHLGTESNAATFILLPAVTTITYFKDPSAKKDHTLTLTTPMPVGLDQKVSLLLNRTTAPSAGKPWSYSLSLRPRTLETDPLVFAAKDVESGTYIYRLRIDNADSALHLNTTNPDPMQQPYDGPTVVVT